MPPPPPENFEMFKLHLDFMHFRVFQRLFLINSIYFNFLILLFPYQCRFFQKLFWFYFTMKVARGRVHNSQRKSSSLGP